MSAHVHPTIADGVSLFRLSSEGSQKAPKVVAFRGRGAEEDALSFAPGRVGNVGDVIAAELATGASVDDEVDELSV